MKIVPVFLRYNYGDKSRGDSLEYKVFYAALKGITSEVYPFWYDDYLREKDKLQKLVTEFVDKVNPDIVFFILMKDEFSFETLDYLKSRFTTVNWFLDDQWRFDSFTRHYAPHFTCSVTTDKSALIKYKDIGYKNAVLGHSAAFGFLETLDVENIKYKYDVAFVGTAGAHRRWIVKEMSRRGIEIACFGYGWKNGFISYEEMAEIFKTSKINLSISDSVSYDIRCITSSIRGLRDFLIGKKTSEQINGRTFDIPAFGGFQLAHYVPQLEDYFEIGKEVGVYASPEGMADKIRYYLRNENKRREILTAGYKRSVPRYTYFNRMKEIFEAIQNIS